MQAWHTRFTQNTAPETNNFCKLHYENGIINDIDDWWQYAGCYNALPTITPVSWTILLSLDLRISNKSRMGLTYTSFAMVTLFTDGQCGTHPHRRYPVLYNVIASLNTRNRFPCSLPVSTAIRVTIKVTRQRFQFLDKHII